MASADMGESSNPVDAILYKQCHNQYWYGIFGDFNLLIDRDTGYFNATKLCKEGGRRFKKWFENDHSKRFITFLKNNPQKRWSTHPEIYYIEHSRAGDIIDAVRGTYLCPELAPHLASWISLDFASNVSFIVWNYHQKEFFEKYKHDNEALVEHLKRVNIANQELQRQNAMMVEGMQDLKIQNEMMTEENQQIKIKHEKMREDVVLKPHELKKRNMLAIINKNTIDSIYPYYVIRCQKGGYGKALRVLRMKFPGLEVMYKVNYNPNGINMYNRMKEDIPYIKTKYNGLKVDNLDELIADMEKMISNV